MGYILGVASIHPFEDKLRANKDAPFPTSRTKIITGYNELLFQISGKFIVYTSAIIKANKIEPNMKMDSKMRSFKKRQNYGFFRYNLDTL